MLPDTKRVTTKAALADEAGRLTAVVSTFNVIDSDGDIVLPSAFTAGQEAPMVWAHDWTRPIGKGVIRVEPERAVWDGQLFLSTTAGRDAYETIKQMGDLQEYSWGFRVLDAGPGEQDGTPVRFIKRAELFEVSPVLIGANRETYTLAIKHGLPLPDHAAQALAACDDLIGRYRSLADRLREEKRGLSSGRRERITATRDEVRAFGRRLTAMADELDALLADFDPPAEDAGKAATAALWELTRWRRNQARLRAAGLLSEGVA